MVNTVLFVWNVNIVEVLANSEMKFWRSQQYILKQLSDSILAQLTDVNPEAHT